MLSSCFDTSCVQRALLTASLSGQVTNALFTIIKKRSLYPWLTKITNVVVICTGFSLNLFLLAALVHWLLVYRPEYIPH